jgi:hypothetical protein
MLLLVNVTVKVVELVLVFIANLFQFFEDLRS